MISRLHDLRCPVLKHWMPMALTAMSTLLVEYARADILFLDLNVSESEVAAARRAAKVRNEEVHVIPEIPSAIRKQIWALDHRVYLNQQKTKSLRKKAGALAPESAKAKQMLAQIESLEQEIKDLLSTRGKVAETVRKNEKDIDREIRDLQNSGIQFTSIVVSGHSNGTHIFGSLAHLSEDDFGLLLKKNTALHSRLNGVYLWGCYTGTRKSTLTWKDKLPTAEIIMGFHEQGPTNMTTGGPTVLESALIQEPNLMRAANIPAAERALRQIKEAAFYPLAALIHDQHVGIKIRSSKVSEQDISCAAEVSVIRDGITSQFFPSTLGLRGQAGEINFSNSSPLRSLYARFQANQHCEGMNSLDIDSYRFLAILHPKQVRSNFVQLYLNDLIDLHTRVRELPLGNWNGELMDRLLNGTINQHELSTLIYRLNEFLPPMRIDIDSDSPFLTTRSGPSELSESQQQTVERMDLMLLKFKCTPLSWIEPPIPGMIPEAPRCD